MSLRINNVMLDGDAQSVAPEVGVWAARAPRLGHMSNALDFPEFFGPHCRAEKSIFGFNNSRPEGEKSKSSTLATDETSMFANKEISLRNLPVLAAGEASGIGVRQRGSKPTASLMAIAIAVVGASLAVSYSPHARAQTTYYSVNSTGGGNEANDGATGADAIAAGKDAEATTASSIAIGRDAKVVEPDEAGASNNNGTGGVAIGQAATVRGGSNVYPNVAIGLGASAGGAAGTGVSATALGGYAKADGTDSTAIGKSATAVGSQSTAVGAYTVSSDVAATAIGERAQATNNRATALGFNTQSTGNRSTAVGAESVASNAGTAAFGYDADATGYGATSLGARSSASGDYAAAVGFMASASGDDSAALGFNTFAVGDRSLALGSNSAAATADSVALGSYSVAGNATPVASGIIDGTTYNYAGANPASVVSVGKVGFVRQITNVAAGRVSETSTDAINGSQLFATNQAIEAVSKVAHAGWNLSINGDAATNVAPGGAVTIAQGTNIVVNRDAADPSKIVVATTPNLVADSVSINGGATIDGSGINMAGDRITNVGAGIEATDAVNLGQLNDGLTSVLDQVNNYTDQRFNEINFNLSQVRRDARAGTAAAMAMSQIPQAFEPGMGIVGVGVSTWQGEQAMAFGISKASDNGRIVVKVSGSVNSRGKGGAAAGAGFQF